MHKTKSKIVPVQAMKAQAEVEGTGRYIEAISHLHAMAALSPFLRLAAVLLQMRLFN